MTILSRDSVTDAASDARYPRIGYKNLFREGTVSVSSETESGPKEQAYDGFTYDYWQTSGGGEQWIEVENASAQPADYMAIAAHSLAGCDVTPQFSNDGAAWTDIDDSFLIPDNGPIVWEFDSVSANFFRLLIENAPDQVVVGAIHCGEMLKMQRGLPVGWEPPVLNEDVEYTNTMSEGGQILGRNIVRRGVKCEVVSNPVTWSFARGDWESFVEVANIWACFFWWAFDDYSEIVYGGMIERKAAFSHTRHLNVQFKLAGVNR